MSSSFVSCRDGYLRAAVAEKPLHTSHFALRVFFFRWRLVRGFQSLRNYLNKSVVEPCSSKGAPDVSVGSRHPERSRCTSRTCLRSHFKS